jgi:hypothetical protein
MTVSIAEVGGGAGVRGHGKSLDDSVCGRRFLFGGVLLVPLPLSFLGFVGENLPLWACDVGVFCAMSFLKAS